MTGRSAYPVQYDPSQPYVIYQAMPTGGMFPRRSVTTTRWSAPDYSGWWRRTLAILRQGWRTLAVLQFIGFVLSLLFSVPQALLMLSVPDDLARAGRTVDPDTGQAVTPDLGPMFGLFGVTARRGVPRHLVSFAVAIACNHVAVSVAAGLRPRIGAALGLAVRRVFPLLGWQILAGLIMLVGFCACILPAIYLSAVFLVLPAVVTSNGARRRSAAASRSSTGPRRVDQPGRHDRRDLHRRRGRRYIIGQVIELVPGQPVRPGVTDFQARRGRCSSTS